MYDELIGKICVCWISLGLRRLVFGVEMEVSIFCGVFSVGFFKVVWVFFLNWCMLIIMFDVVL